MTEAALPIDLATAPPPPEIAPDTHLPGTIRSIQILRFIAAFVVVMFHAHVALVFRHPGHVDDWYDLAWGVGASGVHIFFVISGFVMVFTSYRGRGTYSPRAFLKRRFMRIYPIYWLLAAIYVAYHWLVVPAYALGALRAVRAALLVASDSAAIIGPGWTLAYEVYFYLCFAVSLLFGMRRGLALLTIYFVASVAAGLLVPGLKESAPLLTNGLLLEFMLGCWLGYAFLKGVTIPAPVALIAVAAGFAAFAAGVYLDYDRLPSVVSFGVPSLLIVSGALMLERFLKGRLARWLSMLGDSSYFLYLAHILLLDMIMAVLPVLRGVSIMQANLVAVPLAVACLIVADRGHRMIEVPLLKVMKAFLYRRPAAPLPAPTPADA